MWRRCERRIAIERLVTVCGTWIQRARIRAGFQRIGRTMGAWEQTKRERRLQVVLIARRQCTHGIKADRYIGRAVMTFRTSGATRTLSIFAHVHGRVTFPADG